MWPSAGSSFWKGFSCRQSSFLSSELGCIQLGHGRTNYIWWNCSSFEEFAWLGWEKAVRVAWKGLCRNSRKDKMY
jgi:hypothetical protein